MYQTIIYRLMFTSSVVCILGLSSFFVQWSFSDLLDWQYSLFDLIHSPLLKQHHDDKPFGHLLWSGLWSVDEQWYKLAWMASCIFFKSYVLLIIALLQYFSNSLLFVTISAAADVPTSFSLVASSLRPLSTRFCTWLMHSSYSIKIDYP